MAKTETKIKEDMKPFVEAFAELTGSSQKEKEQTSLVVKKTGRPSKYTKEMAEDICQQLSEGIPLREICRQEGYLKDLSPISECCRVCQWHGRCGVGR
jgi:hypothetical protein